MTNSKVVFCGFAATAIIGVLFMNRSALLPGSDGVARQDTLAHRQVSNSSRPLRETGSVQSAPSIKSSSESAAPMRPVLREQNMTVTEAMAHPRGWMLAYSAEDAVWLDRFGYPSLAEEEMLSSASDDALLALVQKGDLNARLHHRLRRVKAGILAGDKQVLNEFGSDVGGLLANGGPYQAAKVASFFVDLTKNRAEMGKLDTTQLKLLEFEILNLYQTAKGISALFGDEPSQRNFRTYSVIGGYFGLPEPRPQTMEAAMGTLSNMNASRLLNGLPSFQLENRPKIKGQFSADGTTETFRVFLR